MILIAALVLGGFLMYRWKKRKERQAEIAERLAAERRAREEARRAEEARLKAEAEERRRALEANEIEEDNLTPEEKQQLTEKDAILKFIDEKPAEAAMLIKTWLAEDD